MEIYTFIRYYSVVIDFRLASWVGLDAKKYDQNRVMNGRSVLSISESTLISTSSTHSFAFELRDHCMKGAVPGIPHPFINPIILL